MSRILIPLSIFAGFGVYFAFQVCPTFYFWDSAELTAAVLSNGVPHPPGFPVFLALAGLWKLLIPVEPAYALNLFSAFFAALGLGLWYLVIKRVIDTLDYHRSGAVATIIAFIGTVLMGVSFTYGIQATRFEVYSLNFAGLAALLLLAIDIKRHEPGFGPRKTFFFVLLGLMLGVHNLTIALAVPGLLIIAGGERRSILKQYILGAILALTIAFGFYLIIYLRAQGNPTLNWGNPSNLKSLLNYIFISDFSTSIKGGWFSHFAEQAGFVISLLARQIGLPGLLLAGLGAVYFTLNNRRLGFGLLTIFALNIVSISLAANYFYENFDLHGYLLISLAVAIIYLAIGFEFIYQIISRKIPTAAIKGISTWGAIITVSIGLAICINPILDNLFSADLSDVTTARNFADDFLKSSPENGVLLTSSYNTYFALLAQQAITRRYDNRIILNIYNWDHAWGRDHASQTLSLDIKAVNARQEFYRAFVNSLISRRPIFVEYDNSSRPLARYLHPRGLGYILSTDSLDDQLMQPPDDIYFGRAKGSKDIESIRTWVLWLQCRGEYYRDRGFHELADQYFSALNTVASNADIK